MDSELSSVKQLDKGTTSRIHALEEKGNYPSISDSLITAKLGWLWQHILQLDWVWTLPSFFTEVGLH